MENHYEARSDFPAPADCFLSFHDKRAVSSTQRDHKHPYCPRHDQIMAGNGMEKRKADEMTSDSVEVPLAELRDVAAKAGEIAQEDNTSNLSHV